MATFKPKLPLIDNLITQQPPKDVIELSNVASKIMRYKVLLDRETRGFQKVDMDGPRGAFEHGARGVSESTKKDKREPSIGYTHQVAGSIAEAVVTSEMVDKITIVDVDSVSFIPGITNDVPQFNFITLPFVPGELDYSMSSKFVGIATLSRNNPYYQFTGSEDTLTFEIDWFSEQLDRKDVINNCRWLESLTKADSYNSPPHRVMLLWGASNLLWQDMIWVLTNAPYKLKGFNRGYRDPKTREFVNTNMLPQQAHQSITLKRVTSVNLSMNEIQRKL